MNFGDDENDFKSNPKSFLQNTLGSYYRLSPNQTIQYDTVSIAAAEFTASGLTTTDAPLSKSALYAFRSTLKFLVSPYNEEFTEVEKRMEFVGSYCTNKKSAERSAASEALEYILSVS